MNEPQSAPWWVPYAFIAVLIGAAFTFTLQGKMDPSDFLAFAAALGFRAPSTQEPAPIEK